MLGVCGSSLFSLGQLVVRVQPSQCSIVMFRWLAHASGNMQRLLYIGNRIGTQNVLADERHTFVPGLWQNLPRHLLAKYALLIVIRDVLIDAFRKLQYTC